MIQTETLTINDIPFVRTYSDSGRYVVRDGISYEEAIDPAEFAREYTEGDIIQNESDGYNEAEEVLNILLGGSDDY